MKVKLFPINKTDVSSCALAPNPVKKKIRNMQKLFNVLFLIKYKNNQLNRKSKQIVKSNEKSASSASTLIQKHKKSVTCIDFRSVFTFIQ